MAIIYNPEGIAISPATKEQLDALLVLMPQLVKPSRLRAELTRPADTNNYAIGDAIMHNVANVKQKETITLSGSWGTAQITGAGGLTKTVTFDDSLSATALAFATANAADYLAEGIVLTNNSADLIFEASVAGVPFTAPAIANSTSSLAGTVAHTTANVTAVKQKETITLTGTFGKAVITAAGGLTKIAEYATNLNTTAANFVTAHAAAYLAQGIVVTNSTDTIVFEASVAGTSFTVPAIAYEESDLAGTVAHTTANQVAVKQKDTITLTGSGGSATIDGITQAFNADLSTTAGEFVTNHAGAYLAGGVVLTSDSADLIFEASAAGVAFAHPEIINTTPSDLAGTVNHAVASGVAAKQKEIITLVGTCGRASVTALTEGGLAGVVIFNADKGTTADDFASVNAAAYLIEGIVLTSYGSTLIFEAAVVNVPFTAPTITNIPLDLDGTVENTTANLADVKQKETITLDGEIGFATITLAGGLTKVVRFNGDLSTAASDFVTANATAYDGQGIAVTSNVADIVFEAKVAGTPFTAPAIANTASDLAGTVAHTLANRAAVKMKDTLTLTGTFGDATISAAGGLTKDLAFVTSLSATAAAFVVANAAAYLVQSIVLTSDGADLIFEAQTAGTAFTSPIITNVANLTGTVVHTTANTTLEAVLIEDMAIDNGGAGKLIDVVVITDAVQFAEKTIRIWLFGDIPTLVGDNVAMANTFADVEKHIAAPVDITFGALPSGSDCVIGTSKPDCGFVCATSKKDLYLLVQTLSAVTAPKSAGTFKIALNVVKMS